MIRFKTYLPSRTNDLTLDDFTNRTSKFLNYVEDRKLYLLKHMLIKEPANNYSISFSFRSATDMEANYLLNAVYNIGNNCYSDGSSRYTRDELMSFLMNSDCVLILNMSTKNRREATHVV